jgi:hypothetical protein
MADTETFNSNSSIESQYSSFVTLLREMSIEHWRGLDQELKNLQNALRQEQRPQSSMAASVTQNTISIGQSAQYPELSNDVGPPSTAGETETAPEGPDHDAMNDRLLAYMGIKAIEQGTGDFFPVHMTEANLYNMRHNLFSYMGSHPKAKQLDDQQIEEINRALKGVLTYPFVPNETLHLIASYVVARDNGQPPPDEVQTLLAKFERPEAAALPARSE